MRSPRWVSASHGSVPSNAVVGGKDLDGETIYVARAFHEGATVPGKLKPSHKMAWVPWGGRENSKQCYEVPTTIKINDNYKTKFIWDLYRRSFFILIFHYCRYYATVHQDGCPLQEGKCQLELLLEAKVRMEKHCSLVKPVTEALSLPERLVKIYLL